MSIEDEGDNFKVDRALLLDEDDKQSVFSELYVTYDEKTTTFAILLVLNYEKCYIISNQTNYCMWKVMIDYL